MRKQAIILIAGKSRRMRALTREPKCFLGFGGKKLIDIHIENLISKQYTKIIFVIGYKSKLIREYIDKKYPKNDFEFVLNPEWGNSNVLGSLYFARNFLKKGALVFHGDTLFPSVVLDVLPAFSNGADLVVQMKKCQEEEMKYLLKNKEDNEILFLSKNIVPKQAVGEFMGLTQISPKFGAKICQLLENMPYAIFRHEYYEWALLHVNSIYKLPLKKVDATKFPMIEIDFPEDYSKAKKIFASKIFRQ